MTINQRCTFCLLLILLVLLLAACTGADGVTYPHLITPEPPIPTIAPAIVPDTPTAAPSVLTDTPTAEVVDTPTPVVVDTPTLTPTLEAALLPTVTPTPTPTTVCNIKGNINAKGERIYYLPGQVDYKRTVIDASKGERFFCTEAEAQAAGWRKALK